MQPEHDATDSGPGGQLGFRNSGREGCQTNAEELRGFGGMALEKGTLSPQKLGQ